MPHVYSTLTATNVYTAYREKPKDHTSGNDLPTKEKSVTIHGGANVAGPSHNLHSPRGVVTKVTAEELAILEANPVFKLHKKNGFVSVDMAEKEMGLDAATIGMAARDKSSPLTPADYAGTNLPQPIVDDAKTTKRK